MSFLICIKYNSNYMFLLGQDFFFKVLSNQCLPIRYLRNQRGNNYRKSKPSTGTFSIVQDFCWIIIQFLRFSSILTLCALPIQILSKKTLNILIYQVFSEKCCSIIKFGKGNQTYFFALFYLFCFVSIQIHRTTFKNMFDFFVSYFNQVFYATMRVKKTCVSANFTGLSMLAAYCRSFRKIRKRRSPIIDPSGKQHLTVSNRFCFSNAMVHEKRRG